MSVQLQEQKGKVRVTFLIKEKEMIGNLCLDNLIAMTKNASDKNIETIVRLRDSKNIESIVKGKVRYKQ